MSLMQSVNKRKLSSLCKLLQIPIRPKWSQPAPRSFVNIVNIQRFFSASGTFRLVKLRVVWLFDLRPYYMILVISTLTCQRTCCSSLFIITFSLFRRQGCSHSMPLARFMHARIIKSPSLLETAARLHICTQTQHRPPWYTQTCTFKSQCSKVQIKPFLWRYEIQASFYILSLKFRCLDGQWIFEEGRRLVR